MQVFEEQAGVFERAFFAGGVNGNQNLGTGQYLRKTVHNNL
jgi:hypothetical protein